MRATIVLQALLLTASAACSSSPPTDDGGVDAQAAADASDASNLPDTGCTVTICSGPVSLVLGETVPMGDGCGDTCSYKSGGAFSTCGCSYTSGCTCPDAGDQ